ncbi:MAG: hypothetical protein K5863_03060 [Nitratireductor sp.]|uniref:hypothetical protein n=1 Tax=Nitratireductor sp. TaxID=1872084 RepID=UPI0026099DD9|nr:hypothetical protein [Nitratireductor sp.]MCV0349025.1 hypothetical protein [Nitratireductor sp.]
MCVEVDPVGAVEYLVAAYRANPAGFAALANGSLIYNPTTILNAVESYASSGDVDVFAVAMELAKYPPLVDPHEIASLVEFGYELSPISDVVGVVQSVKNGDVIGVVIHGIGFVPVGKAVVLGKFVAKKFGKKVAKGGKASEKVTWGDENASMSDRARAYDDKAMGARSNIVTQKGQASALTKTNPDGTTSTVRFDGVDGDVMVDRKLSVVTTPKAKNQVVRQSEVLRENGLTGRWEVPTQTQANRATKMFEELSVTNITVKVVPE